MPPLFILADDFTGAHDVGLPFAMAGFRTVVLASLAHLEAIDAADIIVVDTDSRDCEAAEAHRRTDNACAALERYGGRLLYKKIDSTLRGHVGQEIDVVHDRLHHTMTLVVPAFPALGRVTVGGYHLVDGVPVDLTAAGDDPGSAVRGAFVPDMIGRQSRQPVGHVELNTVRKGPEAVRARIDELARLGSVIAVIDAVTDADLDAILRTALSLRLPPLLCGSAGLAHRLASLRARREGKSKPVPFAASSSGPVLVIAGSVHPVTIRQIDNAARHPRITVCRLDAAVLLEDDASASEIERATQAGVAALADGRDAVLALAPEGHTDRHVWIEKLRAAAGGRSLAATLADRLGVICRRVCEAQPPAGLVVTGGETAGHAVQRLGAWGARIVGRLDDGVAIASLAGGPHDGLPVVVKPGGFGGEDGLFASIRALKPARAVSARTAERPVLGITIGDPNGVGPEIIAKTLAMPEIYDICRPLVIGHAGVMARDRRFAPVSLEIHEVDSPAGARFIHGTLDVVTVTEVDPEKLVYGKVDAAAGRLAVEAVIRAAHLAMEGGIQAVVTAPLNKEAMHLAGYNYPGHTELLAELTGTERYRLTLAFDNMLVSHVTTHVSLRQAIERLSEEGVISTIEIIGSALKRMGVDRPRIAVAGLNPHAGEGGIFGDEEIRIIAPAIERARADGWRITGPLPPDTVFLRARRGEFDGIVGMYHDQGHIPVKTVAFDRTVNVSLGMPIIRTSVDHGTAFDIAGRGVANHENLVAAIEMAVRLTGVPR